MLDVIGLEATSIRIRELYKDGDYMKKPNILITIYLFIWAISLIVFWSFMGGSDAMGFGLIFLYTLIPITTFMISLLIGRNNYWGKWKWFAAIVFGVMHMLAEYATFSLKNMVAISFERINTPNFELLLVGAVISALGLGAGTVVNRRKSIQGKIPFNYKAIAILLVVWFLIGIVDYRIVHGFEKPLFCIAMETADDGGSGHYIGAGYSFDIEGNFMPEDELPGVTKYTYYIFGIEIDSGIRD